MTSVLERPDAPAAPPPAPAPPRRTLSAPQPRIIVAAALLFGLFAAAIWSIADLGISLNQIERGIEYAGRFLQRTVPFVWPSFGDALWLSILTLAIVICGTVLAAIISIPVAYLAARNTSPSWATRGLGRFAGVWARAWPDAFLAGIFASVLSQSALPGVLALGFHSVGMISKLTADAIEQIDEGPRLALRAAGATKSQEFWGAIWPQILPSFVATVLHRTDINLRVSVILGFVGVAGLGLELSLALRTLNYREAMPWAIIIFGLCVLFEIVSTSVRSLLLGVTPTGRSIGSRLGRKALSSSTADAAAPAAPAAAASRVRPWTRERRQITGFTWLGIFALLGSMVVVALDMPNLTNFWLNAGIAWNRMWPPAVDPIKWPAIGEAMLLTVQIALIATLFSTIFSLVIGSLAARNVAPTNGVRAGFRFALVGIRGLPELLLAFFFIIFTGLGPMAAIVALSIGGVGLLGKLFADSLEEVNPGPERALRATGASRLQIFGSATLPQATPALIGHVLYMLDTNIRSSALLGIIGAGGIGLLILNAQRINQHEMLALLLLLVGLVLVVEALSSWIRQLVK